MRTPASLFRPSTPYGFVRSRQLEGTFPGSPGTGHWLSTLFRVMKGWGQVEEKLWPDDLDANQWPPTEPEGLDIQAKAHRIHSYQRVSSLEQYRFLIASQLPVQASFEIDDSWSDPPKGLVAIPNGQPITGTHCVLLLAYDDHSEQFRFVNSWGAAWGDAGYGYLPYSYFKDRFVEGWTVTALSSPPRVKNHANLFTSEIKDPFGEMLHCVEIVDPLQDEMIGWGFVIEHESSLLLEEFFVRPNWRRRGYGSQLAMEFLQLADRHKKELFALIPHSDVGEPNRQALKAILHQLGLSRKRSPVRWTGAIGVQSPKSYLGRFQLVLGELFNIVIGIKARGMPKNGKGDYQMEFHPIPFFTRRATPAPPAAKKRIEEAPARKVQENLLEASQNLLKHIPGEASGFYLLAADSLSKPSVATLGLIFVLALILLVVVRWLAKASSGIMVTTIIAFLLWMLILDKGFLHVAFPGLLPPPLGFIVAVFYSSLIAILASAGKIR